MKSILLMVVFFFCLPTYSWAQSQSSKASELLLAQDEVAPKKKKGKRKRLRKRKPAGTADQQTPVDLASDNTSQGIRSRQKFTVALRAGNLVGGFSGGGGEGLYHINKDLLVGAFLATGTEDFKDSLDESESNGIVINAAETQFTMYYAQARYYLGNSFFLNGGLGIRKFTAKFAASDIAAGSVQIDTDATALIAQFGIGNVWRWESGFLIGAEWLGYNQPLTSSFKTSTTTEGAATALSEDFKKSAVELAKLTSETGAAMALVVSVGWAF